MYIFITLWLVTNVLCLCGIIKVSWTDSDYNLYEILFFPVLNKVLKSRLSRVETIIATIIFSIFFAPAIIIYFVLLFFVLAALLIYVGLTSAFEHKN